MIPGLRYFIAVYIHTCSLGIISWSKILVTIQSENNGIHSSRRSTTGIQFLGDHKLQQNTYRPNMHVWFNHAHIHVHTNIGLTCMCHNDNVARCVYTCVCMYVRMYVHICNDICLQCMHIQCHTMLLYLIIDLNFGIHSSHTSRS